MPAILLHNLKQPLKRNVKICTKQLQVLYMFLFSFAAVQQGIVKRFRASGNHSNKEFSVRLVLCNFWQRNTFQDTLSSVDSSKRSVQCLQFCPSGAAAVEIRESQFQCKPKQKQLQLGYTRAGQGPCSATVPQVCSLSEIINPILLSMSGKGSRCGVEEGFYPLPVPCSILLRL